MDYGIYWDRLSFGSLLVNAGYDRVPRVMQPAFQKPSSVLGVSCTDCSLQHNGPAFFLQVRIWLVATDNSHQ